MSSMTRRFRYETPISGNGYLSITIDIGPEASEDVEYVEAFVNLALESMKRHLAKASEVA